MFQVVSGFNFAAVEGVAFGVLGHAVIFRGRAAEFGSERSVADARHQGFGDANGFAMEVWRKVAAGVSGRGGGAAGSNERDGAFVDVEHEGLGAFE